MLIDIHSYHLNQKERITQVLSRNYDAPTQNGIDFFSIGAHPWKLDKFDFEHFRDVIVQNKYDEKFFGIGEIGLDRIKGIELGSQIKIFEEILYFAQEEEIKRILIHCVRSYEEIIQSLKSCKYSGQIIFHDYNGGPEVTEKILKLNSYFSFGANLLRENSKAQKVISDIPQNRIFFESDEKDSPKEAYQKASQLTGTDFQQICEKNFRNLF